MNVFTFDNNNKFNPLSKDFWMRMVIMTIAIWIISATSLVEVHNPLYALLAAIIISFLNAFIRPLLSLISAPLIISTFGIFIFVINAIIVLFTSSILSPHFQVEGFWNAFFFSIIVTFLSFVMNIPRKIKKITGNIFSQNYKDRENQEQIKNNQSYNRNKEQQNSSPNQNKDNRFDKDPFNDDPHQKNYTDFEEVKDDDNE